jgi:hypothetical protein
MAKDVLHVVPHEDNWAVRREGNERVSSTHPTQKDAIEAARDLAKEQDDIVIHRPDGTIRERVTYYGSNGKTSHETETRTATDREEMGIEDVEGVRSRVSWEAVVGGAVVAVAVYFVLSLFALAIGLSTVDRVSERTAANTAAIVSGIILLLSVFSGGFVASRLTARERPIEGVVYGALVWGALVMLLAAGLPGLARVTGTAAQAANPDRVRQELALNDRQAEQYAAMVRENQPRLDVSAEQAAWWAFVAVTVSLLSAMAGGYLGAGPRIELHRRGDHAVATVAPRPA